MRPLGPALLISTSAPAGGPRPHICAQAQGAPAGSCNTSRPVAMHAQVLRNMGRGRPDTTDDLAALYVFDADGVRQEGGGVAVAIDRCVCTVCVYVYAHVRSVLVW